MKDADAAGFNPLTVLRNGGAAGYMSSSSSPTLGSRIGSALGTAGNFLANFNPFADKQREAEFDLVQAQIGNLNASTHALRQPRPTMGQLPTWAATNVEQRPISGKAATLSAGAARTPTVETPTVTNPYTRESGLQVDPNTPDAAASEERYGDILSNVFGVGVAIKDAVHNMKNTKRVDRFGGAWKEITDWWETPDAEITMPKFTVPQRGNGGW